jgi:hypothetical protein
MVLLIVFKRNKISGGGGGTLFVGHNFKVAKYLDCPGKIKYAYAIVIP